VVAKQGQCVLWRSHLQVFSEEEVMSNWRLFLTISHEILRKLPEKSSFLEFMAKSIVSTTAGNKTQHGKEQLFSTAWAIVAHINISLDISMLKCNAVRVCGLGEASLLRILRWWICLSFYDFVLSAHWMEDRVGIRAVTNEGEKKNILPLPGNVPRFSNSRSVKGKQTESFMYYKKLAKLLLLSRVTKLPPFDNRLQCI
jgi:hypothetical protein